MSVEVEHKPTILVVDDELKNIQVVGNLLVKEGYEVLPARDGQTALARAEEGRPDLVLLDVMMPGVDGFSVCRSLKSSSRTRDVPVIFLSAATDKDFVLEAFEAGGVDYIQKPFFFPELLSRVRSHLELRRAQANLKALMKKRSELLGVMAHDLRNPIGAARVSGELLQSVGIDEPDVSSKLIDNIVSSCDGALKLIQSILEADAAEHREVELKLEAVDISLALIESIEQNRQSAEEKGIALAEGNIQEGLKVIGDEQALRRVFDNLISNALKFSPLDTTVSFKIFEDCDYVIAEVCDEGPGFSEEDQRKMFKRYSRLSATPTGDETSSGLGLSIVKDLVDRMGGEIHCQSKPIGTTFCVKFRQAGG